uniref:Uncharacterized protein LOC117351707 n=1 Tax=Geotrypetes seraphini TaxID=260995 RepID=A0A6P8PNK1_GEOSA|nr:uncharacterized protein LOC117351707 [Geotrypetes seraphini]XP_033783330.1 uncharacterized protein LOC117351707 [Geotrypetes seraphini]
MKKKAHVSRGRNAEQISTEESLQNTTSASQKKKDCWSHVLMLSRKMEEEVTGNSSGYPNSDIINATDTPRTRDLKFIRAKRLAYFTRGANKNSPRINMNATSATCKSPALSSEVNTKGQNHIFKLNDFQQTNDEKSMVKLSAQESSEPKFCGMNRETVSTDQEAFRKVQSSSNLELDYSFLENVAVPEIQKLKYVMNWAQGFLENNREDHVQKNSTFPEFVSKSDGNRREPDCKREKSKHLCTPLTAWTHNYDLSADANAKCSIYPKDTEKCISGDTTFFLNEHQHKLQNEDTKEKAFIYQTGGSNDNYLIDSISATQGNNYFWVPVDDSSEDEHLGREVKTDKPITFGTENKVFTESEYNILEGKSSSSLYSSIFESSVLSRRNMVSTPEECTSEEKYKLTNSGDMHRDFKYASRFNSSTFMHFVPDIIEKQHKDSSIAYSLKNDALEDISLDFGIEKRHKSAFICDEKTYRSNVMKSLTEKDRNRSDVNESGFNECNANDNSKDQSQINSDKNSAFHDNMSVPIMPLKDMLLKVCPKCSSENSLDVNWCTECGCVLIGILPQPTKMEHTSKMIQNCLTDDYIVSKAVTESSKKSMNISNEIPKLETKASDHKTKHWKENPEVNSGNYTSALERYFDLNQLNVTLDKNKASDNQSSHYNELVSFSKEDIFSTKPDKLFSHGRICEQNVTQESNICDYSADVIELPGSKNTDVQQEIAHLNSQGVVEERLLAKADFLKLILDDPTKSSETKITRKKPPLDRNSTKTKHIKPKVTTFKRHWEMSSLAWSSYTQEVKPRSQFLQRPCSAEMERKTAEEICQHGNTAGSTNTKKTKESPSQRPQSVVCCEEAQLKSSSDQDTSVIYMKTSNAWTTSKQLCRTTYQDSKATLNEDIQEDSDKLSMWLFLPEELWINIFSFLSHKELSQVAQVCHHFQQLASDEILWRKIWIANCHSLNDEWLISIGFRHPHSFTLYRCHDGAKHITDEGLTQFFRHCKDSLKELNVTNCSGPRLKGDTILLHASTFCIYLTSVDISWTGATDDGVIALCKASLSLQSLSMNGCKITDGAINVLVKKHGKSLNKLEVFGCHTLTAKCLGSMATECAQLQILNIGRVPKVTDVCLAMIASCLDKLTVLNVTGLSVVRDRVVHNIVKRCPMLESLSLSCCLQVTDVSLVEISTYLKTIRYLDVSGCKKVTDNGIHALSRSCYQLSYLDLSSTETGRRGISLLASYCYNTLECLKLSFCKEVTAKVIEKLCKNCKRLKVLHLYGCHIILNLKSIKEANKNLKIFHDFSIPTNILGE